MPLHFELPVVLVVLKIIIPVESGSKRMIFSVRTRPRQWFEPGTVQLLRLLRGTRELPQRAIVFRLAEVQPSLLAGCIQQDARLLLQGCLLRLLNYGLLLLYIDMHDCFKAN